MKVAARAMNPSRVAASRVLTGMVKVSQPNSQPIAQPMPSPAPISHSTLTVSHSTNQSSFWPAATRARAMARFTNGNANPSFSPASDVRPNRTSSSRPSPGAATWMSDASTGSVGDSVPASRIAPARPSPRTVHPSSTIATIDSIMVTPSNRQVTPHRLGLKIRSIFSPAPIRAMITTNSVSRSVISG